ncbi:MAG: CPBP family intramembrane metalloprotease [Bacteroidetes bacterium]|nr:CPBP family intramembrane metalloprotease [Bacteroidota bacterium]
MSKRIFISLIVISTFLIADKLGFFAYKMGWIPEAITGYSFGIYNRWILYILFPLAVLALLHGLHKVGDESGLGKNLNQGISIAAIGVLPMFLGAGFLANFNIQLSWQAIYSGCFLAALAEEVLFRGFLFGQLFRHAKWGFIPAAMVSAIIFGLGHLYQGHSPGETIGIFAVTFLGGMWFSWLYAEWDYNLWVPFGFHFFMNLSWTIFDVSGNALGGIAPNIFRALTIILSIWLTMRHKKQGSPQVVTGKRWISG